MSLITFLLIEAFHEIFCKIIAMTFAIGVLVRRLQRKYLLHAPSAHNASSGFKNFNDSYSNSTRLKL